MPNSACSTEAVSAKTRPDRVFNVYRDGFVGGAPLTGARSALEVAKRNAFRQWAFRVTHRIHVYLKRKGYADD